jgi:hypothetical protein
MNFLDKVNSDDVFFRGLIIGLLKQMNDRITYYQTNSDGKIDEIFIPFFYSLSGDESFLQDFYLNYGDCDGNPAFAEGNYDVVPRGILEYNGSTINTSSSTNKYVRGSYEKEIPHENGGAEMRTFSSYLNPIPVNCNFTARIKVDTTIDAFKIQQRVIDVLFRNFVYYTEFAGVRIPAQVSLGEAFPEKNPNQFSFTYATKEPITLSFNMVIETYLPQFDYSTEKFRGNLMQGGIRLNVEFGTVPPDNSQIIKGIGIFPTNDVIK